jgi:hypothetical protein
MLLNKEMSEISFKTYVGQYEAVNWRDDLNCKLERIFCSLI